jgi:putative membrane protein
VSEAEHYVEIIADRGISTHIDDAQWENIVAAFVDDVRAGRLVDGYLRTIAECGKLLSVTVPKTPDNRNELDDRLVMIGYDSV